MSKECSFFKYYKQPYNVKEGKKYFYAYRKKDVLKWLEKFDDSVLRPVFDWSYEEVVKYILDNGMFLNPLYKKGAKRVGCFPCVLSSQGEMKNLFQTMPEAIEKIKDAEKKVGKTFFHNGYIPKRFCTGSCDAKNRRMPKIEDVVKYVSPYESLFKEQEKNACLSYYNICE